MSVDPRAHFGILSAEIIPASELLPLINTMTLDEQIIVIGKLRSLEVVLLERINSSRHLEPAPRDTRRGDRASKRRTA
jgi:hypothetical protein